MKVGTDAVLLGSWAESESAHTILDIGTGCGIIALMLAQRFEYAMIDAIDIDEPSIIEASVNFSTSPWPDRLKALVSSVQSWQGSTYDLIVSNPPYFPVGFPIPKESRALARHQQSLDFDALLHHVIRLLNPNGKFALILPNKALDSFNEALVAAGLHCNRITEVLSFEGKPPVLVLLEIGFKPGIDSREALCIRSKDGSYHPDYLSLTRAFYLFS